MWKEGGITCTFSTQTKRATYLSHINNNFSFIMEMHDPTSCRVKNLSSCLSKGCQFYHNYEAILSVETPQVMQTIILFQSFIKIDSVIDL